MVETQEKSLQKYMNDREDNLSKTIAYVDQKIKVIDDYLSSHSETELSQPTLTTTPGEFK